MHVHGHTSVLNAQYIYLSGSYDPGLTRQGERQPVDIGPSFNWNPDILVFRIFFLRGQLPVQGSVKVQREIKPGTGRL